MAGEGWQFIGQCMHCFLVVIATGKGLVAVRRPMRGTMHCSLWSEALLITATPGAMRQAIIVTTFPRRWLAMAGDAWQYVGRHGQCIATCMARG